MESLTLLPNNVMGLLRDCKAIKTLATIAQDGTANLQSIKAIKAPESNLIVFALTDAEQLYQDLVYSMNAGRLISILCSLAEANYEVAFQIVCRVQEFQTAGPLYDKFLDELRARSSDLEGVWVLEPIDVIDRSTNDLETRI